MTHQGPPPPQPGKTSTPGRPGRRWAEPDDTDGDLPPWAGLGVRPRMAEPSGRPRRGQAEQNDQGPGPDGGEPPQPGTRRSRALARARRTRRTRYIWAATALVVIAVAVVEVSRLLPHHAPRNSLGLVTTFQQGEFQAVPSACSAVTAATLGQYLPGTRRTVVPHSLDGRAESMCDWSVDAPPMYRLLDVTVQAYAPSGLASGDGSATNAAIDAYRQAMQQKRKPPAKSHQPPAAVSTLPGVGTAAFSGVQVLTAGGDTTDLVTVVVRQHNVLITVVFDGLAHSPGGKYGHESVAELKAGAAAAARDILAGLR